MILELQQELWLETKKGRGLALALLDYGPNSDMKWVCVIEDTGEVWTFSNPEVRVARNITLGINMRENKP